MRTSTKRILSILLAAIFLIGLIVVVTSLIKPEFEDVMDKRTELYSREQVFDAQVQAVGEVDQLIQDIEGFDKLQETVSLAVPLSPEVPGILNQLDAIARTSNVALTSFASEPQSFEGGKDPLVKRLGVLGISLTVTGDYQNLKDFVRFMETNVRVFNIKSYILSGGGFGGGGYEMAVEANTYYQE